ILVAADAERGHAGVVRRVHAGTDLGDTSDGERAGRCRGAVGADRAASMAVATERLGDLDQQPRLGAADIVPAVRLVLVAHAVISGDAVEAQVIGALYEPCQVAGVSGAGAGGAAAGVELDPDPEPYVVAGGRGVEHRDPGRVVDVHRDRAVAGQSGDPVGAGRIVSGRDDHHVGDV